MNFKEWISTRRFGDGPLRDLQYDIKNDNNFPVTNDFKVIGEYLKPHPHAYGAFLKACRDYKRGVWVKPVSGSAAYKRYAFGAYKRSLEFELTSDDVDSLITKDCDYCGISPAKGIDRVDNAVGYTLENCVPCCKTCNVMKMTLSVSDFINHVRRIASLWSAGR